MFYRGNIKIEFCELDDIVPMEYKRLNDDGFFILPCMIDHDSVDVLIACVGDLSMYGRFDHQLNFLFHQLGCKPLKQAMTFTAIDANHFIEYLHNTTQFFTDVRHILDVSSLFILKAFPYDVSEYEKTKVVAVEDDFKFNGKPRVIIEGNNEKLFPLVRAFNSKKGRYQDGYYLVQLNVQTLSGDADVLFDPKFINTVTSGCLVIRLYQSHEGGKTTVEWIRNVIIPQILYLSRLAYVIVSLEGAFGNSVIYDDLIDQGIVYE